MNNDGQERDVAPRRHRLRVNLQSAQSLFRQTGRILAASALLLLLPGCRSLFTRPSAAELAEKSAAKTKENPTAKANEPASLARRPTSNAKATAKKTETPAKSEIAQVGHEATAPATPKEIPTLQVRLAPSREPGMANAKAGVAQTAPRENPSDVTFKSVPGVAPYSSLKPSAEEKAAPKGSAPPKIASDPPKVASRGSGASNVMPPPPAAITRRPAGSETTAEPKPSPVADAAKPKPAAEIAKAPPASSPTVKAAPPKSSGSTRGLASLKDIFDPSVAATLPTDSVKPKTIPTDDVTPRGGDQSAPPSGVSSKPLQPETQVASVTGPEPRLPPSLPSPKADVLNPPSTPDPPAPAKPVATTTPTTATQNAALELANVLFCTQVFGFGQVEAIPDNAVVPGQKVLLYSEVRNFSSKTTGDDFETALRSEVTIESKEGLVLVPFDFGRLVDRCKNKRSDFYCHYAFTLPETLAPGEYVLRLKTYDLANEQKSQKTIEFVVRDAGVK